MTTYRRSPGFFLARGFLGVCLVGATLGLVSALVGAVTADTLSREFRSRPRDVTIDDPTIALALINAAPVMVQSLVVIAVAWSLLVVVVDIQRGVPFDGKAARRLTRSAVVVTVGVFTHAAVSGWADVEVLQATPHSRTDGFWVYFTGSVLTAAPWFLTAALLAVFAHAFREGQRLKHDSEGLV